MAIISRRGKAQDTSHDGGIRVEVQNDRIVFTEDGIVVSILDATGQSFYTPNGLIYKVGKLADGRYGTSLFDPITGRETMRSGILPDDNDGWIVAKEGEDINDAFT